jgi:hypothetical protein
MPLLNDVRHWQDRAEEIRAVAGQMNDADAKRTMLGIAEGYDHMARLAEGRLLRLQPVAKPRA